MGQAFQVIVIEASGRERVKTAIIGGGGSMTPQQLEEHYIAINAFPGAKSVEITELDGTIIPPRLEELKKKSVRRSVDQQLRPLTTPRATIKPKYVLPEEKREPVYRNPLAAPFAGDGLGNPPASLVNSPNANAARENYEAAQAAGASSGEEPDRNPEPPLATTSQRGAEMQADTTTHKPESASPPPPPVAQEGQPPKDDAKAPAAASKGSPPPKGPQGGRGS
jgi:hypothetical protein